MRPREPHPQPQENAEKKRPPLTPNGIQSHPVPLHSKGFSGVVEAAGCAGRDTTGAFAGARGGADFAGVGCARAATILAVAALLGWQVRCENVHCAWIKV